MMACISEPSTVVQVPSKTSIHWDSWYPGGDAPGRTLRLPPGSMKQRHVVQDAGVDLGRH